MKKQLCRVRAFLNLNMGLLEKSPSEWPVAHSVLQLASQEADTVFAHVHSSSPGDEHMSLATCPPLIYWVNKPKSCLCRSAMRTERHKRREERHCEVEPVIAYSNCGRKEVHVEGCGMVVCDSETGVTIRIQGHNTQSFYRDNHSLSLIHI